MAKYAAGTDICEGINFDFSMMYLYGQPCLWQVFTLANLQKQKELILAMKKDEETGKINWQEVMMQKIKDYQPHLESKADLWDRAHVIKQFMREYIAANPLDSESQEKYCIVTHSAILSALTAKGIDRDSDTLIDYYWYANCQMLPFSEY